MNLHNQSVWESILEYWFLIAMLITSLVMAMFRTAQEHGKVDILEALMCSTFSFGVWFTLSWLNLPQGTGVLIGGLIGYLGTKRVSKWVGDRLGINTSSNEDSRE